MPTYEYQCDNGHKFDRFLKLANYKDPQTCECGAESKRLISPTMIAPAFEPYESPITGKPITSKKARIEDLASSGCVPYETGMVEENNRRLRNEELKLENAVDATVDHEISKMSSRKQELLEQSMNAGADIEYGRH
ncbi:MAG: hypothetical protein GWN00_20025 [Aliifodinibius sp.]|nr:zinc ribbon domain-containing protein [Fodinibius sp.]NIY27010.1 hypothetical protein [Fodinibius sp.]